MTRPDADSAPVGSLAFVVVTYNTRELLRTCLTSMMAECSSLPGSLPTTTVVVDNASSDGTADMVRDAFPCVTLVANPENLGPARGFNLGLAVALSDAGDSDAVVVMNSDIEIPPGTIRKMVAFLDAHPRVDGVSVPLYFPGMTPQKTRTHIVRFLPIGKAGPFRADFPGTTFAMIRAGAFREVGGYDENYYFYNEDLDWAQRAKRLGCVFCHLPEAGAIHAVGQGRKHNVPSIIRELYRSNLYFYKRHYPGLAWLAYPLLGLEIAARILGVRRRALAKFDPLSKEEARRLIQVYLEARQRMDAEYRAQTIPQIPRFGRSPLKASH